MWRRLRWVLLTLLVVVGAAAVTAVVVEKPTLDDGEQAVDARWAELREPLTTRYDTLDHALAELDAIGEADRAVTKDLRADLTAWRDAMRDGSGEAQTEAANRLEGQAARLRANIVGSPRLKSVGKLSNAVTSFESAAPPKALVRAYNRAVRTYEDDRTAITRRPVALAFSFGARPLFFLGA